MKETKSQNLLELDEVDRSIINLLLEDPYMSHSGIAEKIQKSQPTVGVRIKKLGEMGFLQKMFGINIKKIDLCLAKIEIQSSEPNSLKKKLYKNKGILCVFTMTGNYNINVLMMGKSMKNLQNKVNKCLKDEKIVKFKMDFITGVCNDFILPINI